MQTMKKVFETAKLGGLTLKKRLVRSAIWEGIAQRDGGIGSDKQRVSCREHRRESCYCPHDHLSAPGGRDRLDTAEQQRCCSDSDGLRPPRAAEGPGLEGARRKAPKKLPAFNWRRRYVGAGRRPQLGADAGGKRGGFSVRPTFWRTTAEITMPVSKAQQKAVTKYMKKTMPCIKSECRRVTRLKLKPMRTLAANPLTVHW